MSIEIAVRYSPLYRHFIVRDGEETFTIPWSGRERLVQWLATIANNPTRAEANLQADRELTPALIAGMNITNELEAPQRPRVVSKLPGKITDVNELLKGLGL